MNRIALEDGRWFDADRAKNWCEDTRFDGSNRISVHTGSQWDHETLYLTAGGTWVLERWSQRQESVGTYTVIDPEDAARWLIRNDEALPEQLAEFEKALEI